METRPRLLIVDDQPDNIRILMHAMGYEYLITSANEGASALEMARALWQHGGLQVLRVRLCAMAQRGVLVRVTKGRYRLA